MKKIYLILIVCLLTVISSYSAFSQKNITPLQDSINVQLKDSVSVPLYYLKQANKCFIEVKSLRTILQLNKLELNSKNIEINDYKLSIDKCNQANDTLNKTVIPLLQKKSDDYDKLYSDFKSAYKKQKAEKIGISISIPVAAVLSFLLGFYLHR